MHYRALHDITVPRVMVFVCLCVVYGKFPSFRMKQRWGLKGAIFRQEIENISETVRQQNLQQSVGIELCKGVDRYVLQTFGPGDTIMSVPHYLRRQVKPSLFANFHDILFHQNAYVDKEASASGGLCPRGPLYQGSATGSRWGTFVYPVLRPPKP